MKKGSLLFVALVLGVWGLVKAAVEVIPHAVDEGRNVKLVKDNISGGWPHRLQVTCDLKGPEVETAVKFGDLKLDEAVDDQGSNLIPKADSFGSDKTFKEFTNEFFRKDDPKGNLPQIEITLGLPKRAATKIARLRGSVSVATAGTIKAVELGGLKEMAGKKLDIPAAAGLEISVSLKPDETKKINSIALDMKGDEGALESIEVVDASGTKVSNGIASWSFNGGPPQKSLDLNKPIDATMKLVVKVAVDRKITKVPFDLKDIPLP